MGPPFHAGYPISAFRRQLLDGRTPWETRSPNLASECFGLAKAIPRPRPGNQMSRSVGSTTRRSKCMTKFSADTAQVLPNRSRFNHWLYLSGKNETRSVTLVS